MSERQQPAQVREEGSSPSAGVGMHPKTAQSDTPEGVTEDDEGRYWVDLTRRQTLAGLGAAATAVMAGVGAAADGKPVGGGSTVGSAQVPAVDLDLRGTLRELFVVVHPWQAPEVEETPSLTIAVNGGERYDAGPSPRPETDTVRTNMAELHVVGDPANASVGRGPALVASEQAPGLSLVVGGKPHRRAAVGGSASRANGADTVANLPTPTGPELPAFEVAESGGIRVNY